MIYNKKISMVFPCRNEEKAIKNVFKRIPGVVDEVIIVDNLSSDKTVETAKKLGAKVLIEERHDDGIGYGYALARGIKNATGDIVVCMDCDGSYPPEKIRDAVAFLLKNQLDFVSCNRLPFKNKKDMSAIRMFGVWVLNIFVNALYGYPIKDSLSGMWVFKRRSVKNLSLFEGGWNLSLEIKLNAIEQKDINFNEFQIPYKDRQFDQSKQNIFKTGLVHLLFLFKRKLSRYYALSSVSRVSLFEL
jgi:dolichol-phosphate hexosyltransferase